MTLIEVMVSMAILAIGILGVAQMQVLASAQNGIARRTSRAASIARDFSESAQRWSYTDARLADTTCDAFTLPVESALGSAEAVPNTDKADFTATAINGNTTDALTLGGTVPYDGLAAPLLGNAGTDKYQLLWTVRQVDLNSSLSGCEGKVVTVIVRYPIGNGATFRNLLTSFLKYDDSKVVQGGFAEQL
ncbi:MAG: prepilin-type N-terminal cleavage/methylation domain-containing protein [Myxococcales bacterium]|nr:prepilin-type N-terminal cleavage/methylation domain-containing protein [Myxococcales bacterium]